MGRPLSEGQMDIVRELNADGWTDDAVADGLDCGADVLTEIYRDLDAARCNQRRLEEHEQAHIAAMLATEQAQAALWDSAPF